MSPFNFDFQATISWSVGLCVTGGSVQKYQIKLTESNTEQENELDDDPRVQFKNQDKQGKIEISSFLDRVPSEHL